MKALPAGMIVSVEMQATIVGSTHPLNPYWYRIQYPDGRQDVVPLSRLSWQEEKARKSAGRVRRVMEQFLLFLRNRLTPLL